MRNGVWSFFFGQAIWDEIPCFSFVYGILRAGIMGIYYGSVGWGVIGWRILWAGGLSIGGLDTQY
jgi:hypothetical protein